MEEIKLEDGDSKEAMEGEFISSSKKMDWNYSYTKHDDEEDKSPAVQDNNSNTIALVDKLDLEKHIIDKSPMADMGLKPLTIGEEVVPLATYWNFSVVVLSSILILSLISLILVGLWASSGDNSMLGLPSWKSNLLSWHAILLVSFFICQSVGLALLAFVKWNPHLVIFLRLLLVLASIALFISGITAVTTYVSKQESKPHLIGLHQWLGIATIIPLGATGIFGLAKNMFYSYSDDQGMTISSLVRRRILLFADLSRMLLIVIAGMAVVTGIQEYLSDDVCSFVASSAGSRNPAADYDLLPRGCKLGNGLGITVLLTVGLIVITTHVKAYIHDKETILLSERA